jgi:hypothetical protein
MALADVLQSRFSLQPADLTTLAFALSPAVEATPFEPCSLPEFRGSR